MKTSVEPVQHVLPAAYSRHNAAKYCGISIAKLDQLASRGELRRAYIDRKPLFLRSDLDEFLQSKLDAE